MRSITVILSTYNRAGDLRATLESFCALDREGLDVEFVVVDNNSADDTSQVLDEFRERLPLRSIFHPEPGKNRALNRALDETSLRDIVVFTDDDITPRCDWLRAVAVSVAEHPDHDVFGGRIEILWPHGKAPRWCSESWVQVFAFGLHDFGNEARDYPFGSYPFGANLWVRSSVFAGGLRYDERIGPQPKRRLMGSETTFLRSLEAVGHRMLYTPHAVVGHRVQERELNKKMVARRAARLGRSLRRIYGDASEPRDLWRGVFLLLQSSIVYVRSYVTVDETVAFERRCWARKEMASSIEMFRSRFATILDVRSARQG